MRFKEKLILLAVVAIIVLGIVYRVNNQRTTSTGGGLDESKATVSKQEVKDISQSMDPTIRWIAVVNKDYGFAIQYPSNWSTERKDQIFQQGQLFSATLIDRKPGDVQVYTGASLAINAYDLAGKNAEQWIRDEMEDSIADFGEISRVKAGDNIFYHVTKCSLGCYEIYYIEKQGNILSIATYSNNSGEIMKQYDSILLQMLSTFRFLE